MGSGGHLLLVELLPSDVSAAHVLMGTSVLPLASRYSVARVVHVRGLVDVGHVALLGSWTTYLFQISRLLQVCPFVFCVLEQVLAFVEVVLSSHAPLGLRSSEPTGGNRPPSMVLTTCCWSPTVGGVGTVVEVVEIVEHQVHVLLLLPLEVVYDSLVFVDLYSDVGVGLSGNGSGLDETCAGRVLLHVVITLSCVPFRDRMRCLLLLIGLHRVGRPSIELLLAATHRLVVELPALLLELVVADVKGVSA